MMAFSDSQLKSKKLYHDSHNFQQEQSVRSRQRRKKWSASEDLGKFNFKAKMLAEYKG